MMSAKGRLVHGAAAVIMLVCCAKAFAGYYWAAVAMVVPVCLFAALLLVAVIVNPKKSDKSGVILFHQMRVGEAGFVDPALALYRKGDAVYVTNDAVVTPVAVGAYNVLIERDPRGVVVTIDGPLDVGGRLPLPGDLPVVDVVARKTEMCKCHADAKGV